MDFGRKIKTREELKALLPREAAVIGFTSGVFDLLHPGHVEYLTHAKEHVDLLVVGVNSDASTRSYKGPLRPINDEQSRAAVVAGLAAVDFVFLFDEPDTRRSIEILRPHIYIKGGDYTRERLRSTPLVESYGGRVLIIPFVSGCSTSRTIDRIIERFRGAPSCLPLDPPAAAPAVFLDRDGVIIEHVDYLHDPARVALISGALEAVRNLRRAGLRLVVVTNQPGIGIGYFSKDDFFRVNKALLTAAARAGVLFDRIFYCPHSKGDECGCRKPATGMIERAVEELNIDLPQSFVVGDMTSDVQLAKNAGCRSILVQSGRAGNDGEYSVAPDFVAADLPAAAAIILGQKAAGDARRGMADAPAAASSLQRETLQPPAGPFEQEMPRSPRAGAALLPKR